MKHLSIVLGAFLLCCQSGREIISNSNHPVIHAYLASKPIPSHPSKNVLPLVSEWDQLLVLSDKVSLRITATASISGCFRAQYSDESCSRDVGTPGDYIYPKDLRIDSKQEFIYAVACGHLPIGGKDPVTYIFQFDIQKRKIVNLFQIAPKVIPNIPPLSA